MKIKILFTLNFIVSVIGFILVYIISGVFDGGFQFIPWFVVSLGCIMLSTTGFVHKALMDEMEWKKNGKR